MTNQKDKAHTWDFCWPLGWCLCCTYWLFHSSGLWMLQSTSIWWSHSHLFHCCTKG